MIGAMSEAKPNEERTWEGEARPKRRVRSTRRSEEELLFVGREAPVKQITSLTTCFCALFLKRATKKKELRARIALFGSLKPLKKVSCGAKLRRGLE